MRTLSLLTVTLVSLAVVASCSKTGTLGDENCPENPPFFCLDDFEDGRCSDILITPRCNQDGWVCPAHTIPESACRCPGTAPLSCMCGPDGWICPKDGGAADGGGGASGTDGGAGRGGASVDAGVDAVSDGGSATSCGANPSVCGPVGVCLRKQVLGGVCFPPDGGCPQGYSVSGPCCVMDPAYTCVPRPSACASGELTCACAAPTLCTSGYNCTMPKPGEIDCTLLAP